MNDRHDGLIRRAAELMAESKQLMTVSEGLAGRLAERRKAGAPAAEQPGERRPVPAAAAGTRGASLAGICLEREPVLLVPGTGRGTGVPGGDRAGEVARSWPGTGVLDEDEAVALAVLLEELAAHLGPDSLSGLARRAAALLRRRVTAAPQRSVRPQWGGPASRRESGDTRDGAADQRDAQAAQRDRCAIERDDQAAERDRRAAAADQKARASEQRMRDRLWAVDLRDQAAAESVAEQPPASGDADSEAVRDMLAHAHAARQAALQDRYAAGQDRVAARRDRGAAQADRQDSARDRDAACADRDQAVIESEEEDPRPGTDLG